MNTSTAEEQVKPQSSTTSDLTRLQVYTLAVSAIGLLLNAIALATMGGDVIHLWLFAVLVIIAESTTSEVIAPQMTFSMSTAVAFACIPLFGPLSASLIASIGGLTTTAVKTYADRRQGRRAAVPFAQRALFNMAAHGLSIAAAGWVYQVLGGDIDNVVLATNLMPLIAASITLELLNAAIVVIAVSLQIRQPAFTIWRQNVSWALPINILALVLGGGGLAMGYETTGPVGAAVFFLPVATTIYAFRLYAERTKEQMSRLEAIIAERERAQAELKASLDEKEVLLKEIHHRVKNNLQVISSLLYIQARKVEDPEALEMFKESQNRVRAMALVHERLYQSQDLSQIDFAKYIDSLSHYWLRSYAVDPGAVRLRLDVKDVYLTIETAVPCALLINELASNALKHAFPNGRRGEISVYMRPGATTESYVLRVTDNGVGFPADFDIESSDTLGMQLVTTLVSQIEGTMELDDQGGTAFTVTFGDGN
jgi:two-component sensor histidine kinase